MNVKTFLSKVLTNKMVLNLVTVLSVLSIIGYIMMGDIQSVAIFILLALIIVNFSKNMIIVLGLPMIIVGIFYTLMKFQRAKMERFFIVEGMETKDNSEDSEKDAKNDEKDKNDKKDQETADVVKSGDGSMDMTAVNATEKINNGKNSDAKTDESFEVGRNKKGKYNIDYASTIEDAYDELNKILGSDGVKNLTDDTQKLMKQQMMLAESMQSMEPIIRGMGPLLEKAEGLLGNMGSGAGSINLDSIKRMAEKFTN